MREDFLPYENYFAVFYRFWESLNEKIQIWIEYRNSFYSSVPLDRITQKTQRMLSVYQTGRDCAFNGTEDLNFEDFAYYPSVEKFVEKCGFNISYRIDQMKKCLESVSDIDTDSYPYIYANMLILFDEQLNMLYAIMEKINDLKCEIKNNPLKMNPNNNKTDATYNIQNFHGIFGNVENSNVTQNFTVSKGNFDDLEKVLIQHGLTQNDTNELKEILEEELPTSKDSYGPKLSNWMGKMITKAASGAWDISVSTAGSLIATVIAKYAGF